MYALIDTAERVFGVYAFTDTQRVFGVYALIDTAERVFIVCMHLLTLLNECL